MQDLIFHINKQSLTVEKYYDEIVANSVNYLYATFIFDDYENSDWKNCKKLHAEFSWSGNNKWAAIENGERVAVPWEVIKTPGFTVNVFGTDYEGAYVDKQIRKRITTRPVPIIVKQSGDINGVPGAPFSDEINILIMVDEAHTYSKKALQMAEKCEQRVDELEDLVYEKEVFVGGVNLLNNSRNIELFSNIPDKYPISRATITEKNRIFHRYRRINPNLNLGVLSFYNTIPYSDFTEDISGKMVTFSFLARAQREQMASLLAYMSDPDGGIERLDFSPVTETFLLTTEWKRFSFVVKIDQKITNTAIFRFCPFDIFVSDEVDPRTFYLDICEWKVEHGNIATDWTPSLVETDQQITEVKTSLREEFGKIISEVEGTVETLDGKIIKTNKQVQSLESTTSLITSEAYGANILENSGFHTDAEKWWGYTKDTLEFIDQSAKIVNKNSVMLGQSILGKLQPGETCTGSVKVKVVKPSLTGKLQMVDNGAYQGSWFAHQSKDILVGKAYDWTTFQFSFAPNERIKFASEYHFIFTWKNLDPDCEIYFKELKLERGEWATQWSDRPEDNARHYLELTQTAKDLTAKLGNIEDGNTDYLQFSKDGLVIGDWTSGNLLGANVRIFNDNSIPCVAFRDGIENILLIKGATENKTRGELQFGNWGSIYSKQSLYRGEEGEDPFFSGEHLVLTSDDYIALQGNLGFFSRSSCTNKGDTVYQECRFASGTNFAEEVGLGKYTPGIDSYFSASMIQQATNTIRSYYIGFTTFNGIELLRKTISSNGMERNYGLCIDEKGTGIYIGGHPLDENGEEDLNKKLITPLHYKDGDSVALRWTGTGFITSANTAIHFCIPVSKIIPNGLKVTASEVTIKVRQADGYRFGSSSSKYTSVKDEQVSVSIDKTDGNYVRMAVTLDKDSTSINNDTCGIDVYFTLTFKKS